MKTEQSPAAGNATDEISALIETLRKTEQRLEELTGGEVDAVADSQGRTFLLRRAHEQLRHSDIARQAAILNALPAHVALLDTEGVIVSVNESWRRFAVADALHGPGHAIGVNYLDICDHAQGERSTEAHQAAAGIRAVLSGAEKTCSIEYSCHSPAAQRWFLLTVTPLAEDRPNGAVVMHLDITATRSLEQQFRQAQKMEAFGQLAGGVAHDFNNLLTVINGRAQLSISRFKPGDRTRLDLELIYRTGERAAALTRQLLAFSRQQILEPVVLDLNGVAADMDKMLRRLIREDIDLVTVLDPALMPIKADPGQIEQVIMNLVVNARDAMPKGGKLTIETANAELSEEYCRARTDVKPGLYAMLAVSDSGHGMDTAVQARIFEPFFTTKPKGKGTGLGLATVFGVVKQSKGHIEVYSEIGRGTTFKVYLPQTQKQPVAHAAESQLLSPAGLELILIVEDEEDVRELVGDVLKMKGYTVLTARNGKEALSICATHDGAISLVITDVIMPEMGGAELAAKLKANHPTIKVLFTSGYTDHAIVRNGELEAGVAFIQKPFTLANFATKVRDVLDSKQATASPIGGLATAP